MKRREFLTGALAASSAGALPAAPQRTTLVVKVEGELHPRAQLALDELTASIERSAPHAAASLILGTTTSLPPEHWELTARSGRLNVKGGDARGLVYGLAYLRRVVEQERRLPAALSLKRGPRFPVRRWSTSVSHDIGSPWDERISLDERFQWIKANVSRRAADYGMSSIEINGRPDDGWDVDWMIGFEKYPELAHLFPQGERKRRMDLVEDLARDAHQNLMDIVVWSHELHLPPGFTDLYPQVTGTNYPVCLSSPFLKQFIRDKYIEFFDACPSVDGLVMSVNESGQFSLITDAGCKCDLCIRMSQHERLMSVLNEVIAVTTRLKKQIVLRTFQSAWIHDLYGHPELETIRKAYTGLPASVEIMSKYCPLDFYGGAIADEPLIGAFPNEHLVEFSLDVEWQGRTFVPVLTPANFQRRIAHALEKKCAGIVARVDFPFPSMEPAPIFGHPNEFNAWYMGELLWEPDRDIDISLRNWSRLRYGPHAAEVLAPALRKTEAITQKTFFCQGQVLINYHNMIGDLAHADDFLWAMALSKWDPSKRTLSESFFRPDEDLIRRVVEEKSEAIRLASEALHGIEQARGKISDPEAEQLRYWFEKLRDSAELWRYLSELYLRHRQVASSPAKPDLVERALSDPHGLDKLLVAARSALQKAIEMEHRHGPNSWPVISPDRGVTAYQFVQEILRNYISGVTGEPAGTAPRFRYVERSLTVPVVAPGSVESVWRGLVEAGRPGIAIGALTEMPLTWPVGLRQVELSGTNMTLRGRSEHDLVLPLSYGIRETTISGNQNADLKVRKYARQLHIERSS